MNLDILIVGDKNEKENNNISNCDNPSNSFL